VKKYTNEKKVREEKEEKYEIKGANINNSMESVFTGIFSHVRIKIIIAKYIENNHLSFKNHNILKSIPNIKCLNHNLMQYNAPSIGKGHQHLSQMTDNDLYT